MRTERLIAELASRATPIRPLAPPAARFGAWSAVAIASAAVGFAVFGFRRGLGDAIAQPGFITTGVLAILTAALAGMAALILAIPGAERSPAMRVSAFGLLAGWGAIGVDGVWRAGGFSAASDWYVCFPRVILIGLIPAGLLFVMLWRGAPLRRGSASALAGLAAMAVGSAAIQFICPLDVAAHTFLGHYGPTLAVCGVAALAGSRVPQARTRG